MKEYDDKKEKSKILMINEYVWFNQKDSNIKWIYIVLNVLCLQKITILK